MYKKMIQIFLLINNCSVKMGEKSKNVNAILLMNQLEMVKERNRVFIGIVK